MIESNLHKLYEIACEVRKQSHSPYSKFAVGAALETRGGQIYNGCNVENSAYGLCICAEQVAIAKAASEGHRAFKRLIVVASPFASPCGGCRQVMGEFFEDETMVHAFSADDFSVTQSWSMVELLPDRFQFPGQP